ncbi:DinB family protein [Membranihabitans maritimus]|uniref:DinB family protein n=1 Tax=Membranihabitans maritimus TaxID=2904244 RepID=UPI001F443E51|nr:DinB family protein [Membranihabitans maritimus]
MIHKYPYRIYKPGIKQFPDYLRPYIQLVDQDEGFSALMDSAVKVFDTMSILSPKDLKHRYQDDKWSIEEVLLHIIDNERIFQNRALRISRNEPRALSGYDQDRYVRALPDINRSIESLRDEYEAVRKSTFLLYAGLTKVEMKKEGKVGKNIITLPSIPFIIAGHDLHHLKIFKENYGIQVN